jgi:hypothetical protein
MRFTTPRLLDQREQPQPAATAGALPAARAYAGIAPLAPQALHMPTHIFVQLGMWPDIAASNIVAYKAAMDLNARMHLQQGREDFHTLSWLEYANFDDGHVRRGQEERRAREAGGGSQLRQPGRPRRISWCARALHPRDRIYQRDSSSKRPRASVVSAARPPRGGVGVFSSLIGPRMRRG